MKRSRQRLALAVMCSLAVVACGADDAPDATEAPDTTSAPDATEAPDTTGAPDATEAPDTTSTSPAADLPVPPLSEDEWAEVVAAAEAEGRVVLYSVMLPNQNERLEAAFSAAYPNIEIEIVRTLGGDHQARLETERDTGTDGADVSTHINYPGMIEMAENDELLALPLPSFVDEQWEPGWLHDGYFFNATFQVLGIGCNTQLIDECPTSWMELLDDRYTDEIGTVEPTAAVVQDFWVFLEEQLGGTDGMERFRDQNPIFYSSAVPLQQGLAAGEIGVAGYATAQLRDDAEAGAPVEFIVPQPGWSPPIMAYAHAWSSRPNASLVLLNFIASFDGQTAIGVNGASALDGVDGTLADIANVAPVDIYRATDEWFEVVNAEWLEFFDR